MLVALALLATSQLASSASAAAAPEPIEIQADRVLYEGGGKTARAQGHVVVRTQGILLRAPSLTEDLERKSLAIDGPLFAIDGGNVLVAQRAALEPNGRLILLGVELAQKLEWDPAKLVSATSSAEALSSGKNLLVIFADRIERTGPAHYLVDGLSLTPCEVQAGCTAAWSLSAPHGDVVGGERAILDWPLFRADGVPVLPLPALYVPLAHRQTGFLLPHFAWQAQNGLITDEPFFLTLGQSYDLTLSAGYVTGQSELGLGAFGVQGPRAGVEFRYAPSPGTSGRLYLMALDDLHHDFASEPIGNTRQSVSFPFQRGPRASLHDWHLQDLDDRDGDRLDVSLVSDATLTGQLTTDILYASVPGTRSAATAFHRGDDWLASLDAVVFQDFQGAFSPTNVHEELFGPGSPRTLASTPRLDLQLLDQPLGATPLHGSLDASLARFAALGGTYDLITLGPPVAGPSGPPVSPFLPGRAPVDRADLHPEVDLPIAGRLATAELSAAWREDLWLFEAPPVGPDLTGPNAGPEGERGYPILDAKAGTELSRTFADHWTHAVEPRAELRAIPWIGEAGTVPPLVMTPLVPMGFTSPFVLDHATGYPIASTLPLPYDELDFAAGLPASLPGAPGSLAFGPLPPALWQGKLDVDQRLDGPGGHAELDLGEYFDLAGPESAFGFGNAEFGHWHGDAYAIYSSRPAPCAGCTPAAARLRRLSEAGADLGVSDSRGDTLGGSFVRAVAAGSPRLSAPADALFAPQLAANDPRWALPDVSQATVSANVQITSAVAAHGGFTYLLPAELPIQIMAGAGYHSPQGCWGLDANLVLQPTIEPTGPSGPLGLAAFFVTFDLGPLGGGGTL